MDYVEEKVSESGILVFHKLKYEAAPSVFDFFLL